ncbi:hypothetical protein ENSA5_09320 [Enhygromyxa salina]|uniref:Uncharacterized protein n=1 Tax=Enhygromyxa salina TaxID=215803 RepID=A0A2S9YGN9_9BACT|nr:hypothetical protein ENSA5_09320 [Enhygromyxa salina]
MPSGSAQGDRRSEYGASPLHLGCRRLLVCCRQAGRRGVEGAFRTAIPRTRTSCRLVALCSWRELNPLGCAGRHLAGRGGELVVVDEAVSWRWGSAQGDRRSEYGASPLHLECRRLLVCCRQAGRRGVEGAFRTAIPRTRTSCRLVALCSWRELAPLGCAGRHPAGRAWQSRRRPRRVKTTPCSQSNEPPFRGPRRRLRSSYQPTERRSAATQRPAACGRAWQSC